MQFCFVFLDVTACVFHFIYVYGIYLRQEVLKISSGSAGNRR